MHTPQKYIHSNVYDLRSFWNWKTNQEKVFLEKLDWFSADKDWHIGIMHVMPCG